MARHQNPIPVLQVREHKGRFFYDAVFRYDGRQVRRRIGPAWVAPDGKKGFKLRSRNPPSDCYVEATAHVRAAELVDKYISGEEERERAEKERTLNGPNFREVARAYLSWLEHVKGATPSTLRQHRSDLAEPGIPYARGRGGPGVTAGHIMKALGDRPADAITTLEINDLLNAVAATGVSVKSVTRVRQILSAVFNYGMAEGNGFDLARNPVKAAHRRTLPSPEPLAYYKPQDIEAVAAALESGAHRGRPRRGHWEADDDRRDAELIRIAAYTGLRLGELRELRWGDIQWHESAIVVSRSLSAGVERAGTKGGRIRRFGLPEQAAEALQRLAKREHFTSDGDLVFCNAIGRRIDDSSLRRRYKKAQSAAGVDPLRMHDLRHSFGSLLAAGGVDLVNIQDAMGHAQIQTTMIYMHAKKANEQAEMFTKALAPASQSD